jgi:orotidine-5'-phosphate decarboxylase
MNKEQLFEQIKAKKSFLCVGLDTDIDKIPEHLLELEDPIYEFNKQIIDATADLCVAYKPNIAFYECHGPAGWKSLEKTVAHIPQEIFTIADAKRGDIGNTSNYYAKTFFEYLNFDAVTIAPYMGNDSVTPFLQHEGKWAILLALTSNNGALDFQLMQLENGSGKVYEQVLSKSQEWGNADNLMYVVGATRASMLKEVRQSIPDHFLLVPGVGAQGGSLEETAANGMNDHCGLLINSSRNIIYAGKEGNFAEKAREKALEIQQNMEQLLADHLLT